MSFPLRRIDAEPGVCKHCGGETRCAIEELIIDAGYIAIERKFMHLARCRACGMLVQHPTAKPPELADRTLARRWFIGSIALGIALAITWVSCYLWSERIDRALATSPVVGDRWTIDVDDWPEKLEVSGSRGRTIHTVVKVTAVSDDKVDLVACDMAYSKKDDAEEKCDTFNVAIDSVARAQLGDIYDDAISSVETDRPAYTRWTGYTPWSVGFAITVSLLALWAVIARRWKKQIKLAEF